MGADDVSYRVIADLFEGLVNLNQSNQVVPGVANSWDISSDGLVYTFHLRKNAKWSNGEPVTAEDFVYAFRRNADPAQASPQNVFFLPIKNGKQVINGQLPTKDLAIKALSKDTLQITLEVPSPTFLQSLAVPIMFPLYQPAIKKWGNQWIQPGHIVGNGAYMLKKWVVNGYLLEEKNPYYWDEKNVRIPFIKFLPTNALDGYNHYRAGSVDFTDTPSGVKLSKLKSQFTDQVYNVPYLAVVYYWINMKKPAFQDIRVRKALNMVIDRHLITDQLVGMGRTPAYGVAPDSIQHGAFKELYKTLPSYAWVNWSMSKRIVEAKKLLMAAGFSAKHPLHFELSYNTSEYNKQIALSVMQMWQQAFKDSIDVKLHNDEWKVYIEEVNKGNFDIARMGSNASINAVNEFVYALTCNAPSNSGGSCIPSINKDYQAATHAINHKDYNHYMRSALTTAMNAYLTIPIYNATYTNLVKPRIGGYDPTYNNLDFIYSKWFYFK
ncbi:peptide ABC transporter substrate-binding protein [Cysteiniphilum sp. 6C5]|uniref:peptide ABC transporter substrate-binding protein n=1 Tax=unclassified Cysteiniphilum TaxID=2610889 RepID=UPI003F82B8C0